MSRKIMDSSNPVPEDLYMAVKNTTSKALARQANRGQGVAISKGKKTALLQPGPARQSKRVKVPRNTDLFPGGS